MTDPTTDGDWTPLDYAAFMQSRGRCDRCQRSTWDASLIGTEDRMTQPDGNPCGGKFVRGSVD